MLNEWHFHLVFFQQPQQLQAHVVAICDSPCQLPTSETNDEAWEPQEVPHGKSANLTLDDGMDSQPEVPSLSGVAT